VQADQQIYNQDHVMVFNVALLRGNAGLTAAAMYIMREDMAYRVGQAVQEAARSLARGAGGQRRHVHKARTVVLAAAVFSDLRWSDVTKLAEYLQSNRVVIRDAVSRRLAALSADGANALAQQQQAPQTHHHEWAFAAAGWPRLLDNESELTEFAAAHFLRPAAASDPSLAHA
jgi:hypothetical protein